MILGHDAQVDRFRAAWDAGTLHHAWLLAGPRGIGKASFARAAATRLLADAAGPRIGLGGLATPPDHPTAKLIAAGSHPDFRWIERLENPKTGNLARNISVDQVREVGDFLNLTPGLSAWRAIVIDAADDLESSGANALLKMLEEPPANCVFFLVSHAPGRLLPTIRSRCTRLDFQTLADDVMAAILDLEAPELAAAEKARVTAMAAGSAGRALAFAELDLAPLEATSLAIMRQGDPTNGRRADLALELGKKGAAERYAAFLELVPALVAREARGLRGMPLGRAVAAYEQVRELTALAPRLSLDPASTVLQIGGVLASVADPPLP